MIQKMKKTAVVLGAVGGLGREIVNALLKEGYEVIGSFYPGEQNPFSDEKDVTLYPLAMENKVSIDNFCKELEKIEKIDFLTNTIANTLTCNKFEKIDVKDFEKDFNVNVTNYVYFMHKINDKLKSGSNIVFILTEMVIGEPPNYFSSYVSSKYALLGLMKCLSSEMSSKGIRVNAVSPGMMDTKFTWQMKMGDKVSVVPSFVKEKYIQNSQSKKLVSPNEVAKAIMQIISDNSMHGHNIHITGK